MSMTSSPFSLLFLFYFILFYSRRFPLIVPPPKCLLSLVPGYGDGGAGHCWWSRWRRWLYQIRFVAPLHLFQLKVLPYQKETVIHLLTRLVVAKNVWLHSSSVMIITHTECMYKIVKLCQNTALIKIVK